MKPSDAVRIHGPAIRQIVAAHRAANARVFGSVLRGSDTSESDLDLLIDPTASMTLFDIGAIRHKLRLLLNVEVNVLTPAALPDHYREKVIAEACPV